MRLNHANLPVPDVGALQAFFVAHFDFTTISERGDAFCVMRGADGFILNLMRDRSGAYPDNFHVGFLLDAAEQVRAKHAELVDAGVAAGEVENLTRGGFASTTFYCKAPGNVLVEVSGPAEGGAE